MACIHNNLLLTQTCRQAILDCIIKRMEYMIEEHCKVCVVRFDVHFPVDYVGDESNNKISRLMNKFKEYYDYHKNESQYVWVREENNSQKQHYHVMAFLNGNLTNNVWSVFERVNNWWKSLLGITDSGLIHLCVPDNSFQQIMIVRPAADAMGDRLLEQQTKFNFSVNNAIYAAQYLAKTYTKGNVPAHIREYQGSQLPIKALKVIV